MSATPGPTATVGSTVVSGDGAVIAFERSGPAVILVSWALADRSDTRKFARLLAPHFTVVNYDRRGRGVSSDSADYTVRREIDDIAALIEHAGGSASVFGSSSSAVLALRAAAAGLHIERLALYEPPFAVAPGDFGPPRNFARHIDTLMAEDRRGEAVRAFTTKAQGMPGFMVAAMRLMPGVWSNLKAMAHTLPCDITVMGDTQQGEPLAAEVWSSATAPTLVMTGSKSPDGFRSAARAVTEVLPDADHRMLQGLNHGAVVMAPRSLRRHSSISFGRPLLIHRTARRRVRAVLTRPDRPRSSNTCSAAGGIGGFRPVFLRPFDLDSIPRAIRIKQRIDRIEQPNGFLGRTSQSRSVYSPDAYGKLAER